MSTEPRPGNPGERFAAVLCEIDAELDWPGLGTHYCEGEATGFFDSEAIENLRDAGLRLASDLAAALADLPASGPRRSLYLGAGVFELAPILCEVLVLERRVDAYTLESDERREIARVLRQVGKRFSLRLPALHSEALPRVSQPTFDHVWIVSVLTDPEAFPALHDQLYERRGTPLATARGYLPRERGRALALIERALSGLTLPGIVTTTDEELPLVQEVVEGRGWRIEVPDRARLSGIVGDPVRHCRARKA